VNYSVRNGRIAIRVAGYRKPYDWLIFNPGSSRCGHIMDGVVLEHANCEEPGNHHQSEGGWLIAFEDLEAMYTAAKMAREPVQPTSADSPR
jgi:hypothetical protein